MMGFSRPSTNLFERLALNPDLSRGLRASVSIFFPLVLFHFLGRPNEALFISMAALNLSLPDLRGAYGVRLSILGTMVLVAAGSAFLGNLASAGVVSAAILMCLIVLFSCLWRHLSADYGPFLGVSSALLFLLGMAQPVGGFQAGIHLFGLVCIGGIFSIVLHVTLWIFRPHYPLRYAVAETWVAASNMVAQVREQQSHPSSATNHQLSNSESEMRATLDRTFLILGSVDAKKFPQFIAHLEEMRRQVVHFVMRVMALNTSLEPLLAKPEIQPLLPGIDSMLKALGDAARSVGVSVLLYRSENLIASEVRLRRCEHLICVLEEQLNNLKSSDISVAQLKASLHAVTELLPMIDSALASTTDGGPARFTLPANLPEIGSRSLKSLSAWMNTAERIDPVLVRYAARMLLLTVFAVILYRVFNIPRGYWIAFTIIVVMQPDYGSTRKKAVERIAGTLVGSLLGSVFLFVRPPFIGLALAAGGAAMAFAYFLRTRYDRAVFFVTLLLVLVIETVGPLEVYFTVWRFVSTLIGGGLALVGSRLFWPVWEGKTFPALLATAIRANKDYLESLFTGNLEPGKILSRPMPAKRKAENANRFTAASLERLMGEPESRKNRIETANALTTYNQRITRALNVLALHLESNTYLINTGKPAMVAQIDLILEKLAEVVEKGELGSDTTSCDQDLQQLEQNANHTFPGESPPSQSALIQTQLAKTITEIRAMFLALRTGNGAG